MATIRPLIAKANKDIIEKALGEPLKDIYEGTNTLTFAITEKKFLKLKETVTEQGYNPYALMFW